MGTRQPEYPRVVVQTTWGGQSWRVLVEACDLSLIGTLRELMRRTPVPFSYPSAQVEEAPPLCPCQQRLGKGLCGVPTQAALEPQPAQLGSQLPRPGMWEEVPAARAWAPANSIAGGQNVLPRCLPRAG